MTFILSTLLLIPFVGAIIVILVGLKWDKIAKYLAQIFAFATFVLSWTLFKFFKMGIGTIQLQEGFNWIPDFGINFTLGL